MADGGWGMEDEDGGWRMEGGWRRDPEGAFLNMEDLNCWQRPTGLAQGAKAERGTGAKHTKHTKQTRQNITPEGMRGWDDGTRDARLVEMLCRWES